MLKTFSTEMNCMPADAWGEIKNLPGNDVFFLFFLFMDSVVLIAELKTQYGHLFRMEHLFA